MLRCEICRGHAHAGLAHLHGLGVPLCADCTRKIVEKRAGKEKLGGLFIPAETSQAA